VLGAYHEAALSDGLAPLHLALLAKDLVTDVARRRLAASHAAVAAAEAAATPTDGVDPSTPLAAVLRRLDRLNRSALPPPGHASAASGTISNSSSSNRDSSSSSNNRSSSSSDSSGTVAAALVRAAVHAEVRQTPSL
jgi:hypothetical protein